MCIYIYQNSWVNNLQSYSEQFKKRHLNFCFTVFYSFFFTFRTKEKKPNKSSKTVAGKKKHTKELSRKANKKKIK